jgi:hypothetical protein
MKSADREGCARRHGSRRWPIYVTALAACLIVSRSASAQSIFGTLSNFDVFNDTGQNCHGFEIELDGISKADVVSTFGDPYEQYGNPTVVDFAGGVYVRYESPYDQANHVFTVTTPMAPSVITPTLGHACWTGGGGVPAYPTGGCEHFGVGLTAAATNTVYRWLIADPSNPGSLQPTGTKVSIPAPSWTIAPPPMGGAPIVRAVIPAEPPEVNQQFGDAMWVKVFVTESENEAVLHHLVTDDPAVPQQAGETEVEWAILQAGPAGGNNELANEGQIGAASKSVTRRYEFYAYTGAYDPESHEALCGGGSGSCSAPLQGELGNYIGAQMAAVNLDQAAVGTPTDTPSPTVSPTETPTVSPTPIPTAGLCVGNCNGDSSVMINELITMVNIALGSAQPSDCPSGIPSGATVDITMLIRAVNSALNGCMLL